MKKQQIMFGTLDFINQRLNEGWYVKQVIKVKEYDPPENIRRPSELWVLLEKKSDEELAKWSTEIIDRYFYKCTFEEFKAACKEVFEVDITEKDFEKFKQKFQDMIY